MRFFPISGLIASVAAASLLADCAASSNPPTASLPSGGSDSAPASALVNRRPEITAFAGPRQVTLRRTLPRIHTDGGTTVWVTDAGNNEVFECRGEDYCKPTGSLEPGSGTWNEPQGIAADAKGNVYVADTGNSRIVELSPNGAQLAILTDPGEYPAGVGVANDGTVGVTNICNSASCGTGNIVFYAPGSTTPTSSATGLLYRYYFGGFDSKGNFYNDGEDASGNVHVGVVLKGSAYDIDTGITGTAFPGGVEVSKKKSTLNVLDQTCPCLRAYSLKAGHALLATVPLGDATDPVTFGFTKGDADLWVADAGAALANEYLYPAGGSPVNSYSGYFSQPIGAVAVPRGQF